MSRTRYKFKGYTITNCGYHQPDHCVWWEAVDENGEACFHGHSLREVEFMILDDEWEKKLREKDAEIERLKHSSVGNAAAMRKALMDIDKAVWHGGRTTQGEKDAHWLATTALSAPPRNCDVDDAEEQAYRFHRFCSKNDCEGGCPFAIKGNIISCIMSWAQMQYDE